MREYKERRVVCFVLIRHERPKEIGHIAVVKESCYNSISLPVTKRKQVEVIGYPRLAKPFFYCQILSISIGSL